MPPLSLDSTLVLSQDAMFRDLDGEAVILHVESGMYFGLNHVGTRMWQLIERHGLLRTVFDELCREYEAPPAEIERDLLDLAARLADARLGSVK